MSPGNALSTPQEFANIVTELKKEVSNALLQIKFLQGN